VAVVVRLGRATLRLVQRGKHTLWREYCKLDVDARGETIQSAVMDPNCSTAQQQLLSPTVASMREATSHRRTLSLQDQPVLRLGVDNSVIIPVDPSTLFYTADCSVHNHDRTKKASLDSCTTPSSFYLITNENRDSDTEQLIGKTSDAPGGVDCQKSQNKSDVSCLTIFFYTALVIGIVCSSLLVGRDYIKYVLLSLERSNVCISFLVFSALFTAVSFPMTWGYILLNVAAGYLYGLLMGVVIVMTCALCGIVCAHHTIRRFLRDFVWNRLANDSMRAIVRVVESDSGFKVIVLARLTPIPFGLQNALFAVRIYFRFLICFIKFIYVQILS